MRQDSFIIRRIEKKCKNKNYMKENSQTCSWVKNLVFHRESNIILINEKFIICFSFLFILISYNYLPQYILQTLVYILIYSLYN